MNTDLTPPFQPPYMNQGSWVVAALPYVEQAELYRSIEDFMRGGGLYVGNAPTNNLPLTGFSCPSDAAAPKITKSFLGANQSSGPASSYVGCSGDTVFNPGGQGGLALAGVLFPFSRIRLEHIIDGTTGTLLLSELVLVPDTNDTDDVHDMRGRVMNAQLGGALFTALERPNTPVGDVNADPHYCGATPKAPCGNPSATDLARAARSHHPSGVSVAMCDGSVRFVSDTIDASVWKSMATRTGGEVIGELP